MPAIKRSKSVVKRSSRTVTAPATKVVAPTPKVSAPAPQVVAPTPKIVTQAPQVVTPTPKVVTPAPKVVTQAPQVVTPTPKVAAPSTAPLKPVPTSTPDLPAITAAKRGQVQKASLGTVSSLGDIAQKVAATEKSFITSPYGRMLARTAGRGGQASSRIIQGGMQAPVAPIKGKGAALARKSARRNLAGGFGVYGTLGQAATKKQPTTRKPTKIIIGEAYESPTEVEEKTIPISGEYGERGVGQVIEETPSESSYGKSRSRGGRGITAGMGGRRR